MSERQISCSCGGRDGRPARRTVRSPGDAAGRAVSLDRQRRALPPRPGLLERVGEMGEGRCPVPGVAHGQLDEPGLEGEPGTACGLLDGFAIRDGGEGAEQEHSTADRSPMRGIPRIRSSASERAVIRIVPPPSRKARAVSAMPPAALRHSLQLLRLVDRSTFDAHRLRASIGATRPGRTTSTCRPRARRRGSTPARSSDDLPVPEAPAIVTTAPAAHPLEHRLRVGLASEEHIGVVRAERPQTGVRARRGDRERRAMRGEVGVVAQY